MRLEGYEQHEAAHRIDIDSYITKTLDAFTKALENDLNVSEAISVLYEMIREVNGFCDQKQITGQDAKQCLELLKKMDSVLGICSFTHEAVSADILALVEERVQARAKRDFKRSDAIRDELLQKGYILEDTPSGARVKRK